MGMIDYILRVTQAPASQEQQPGHVVGPAVFIGALSILLAVGLEWLGLLDSLHVQMSATMAGGEAEVLNQLPVWVVWLVTALFAFGVSLAMLGSPRQWRRTLLWGVSLVLVSAWAPVLSLASYEPQIGAPWIVVFWSGACCLVYASNHQMEGDPESNQPS